VAERSLALSTEPEDARMAQRTPIYARFLAVVAGIAGMALLVDAPPFALLIAFAGLGAVFGYVWPAPAWRWGLWTAMPLILTMLASVGLAGAPRPVDIVVILGVPLFACVGANGGAMKGEKRRAAAPEARSAAGEAQGAASEARDVAPE